MEQFIDKEELFEFANECVRRLGDVVREMNIEGDKIGLTKEQIGKVWLTTFSFFPKPRHE